MAFLSLIKTGWNSALTVEADLQKVISLKVGLIPKHLYAWTLEMTLDSSGKRVYPAPSTTVNL